MDHSRCRDKAVEDWAWRALRDMVAKRLLLASNELRLTGRPREADGLMAAYLKYDGAREPRS